MAIMHLLGWADFLQDAINQHILEYKAQKGRLSQ